MTDNYELVVFLLATNFEKHNCKSYTATNGVKIVLDPSGDEVWFCKKDFSGITEDEINAAVVEWLRK